MPVVVVVVVVAVVVVVVVVVIVVVVVAAVVVVVVVVVAAAVSRPRRRLAQESVSTSQSAAASHIVVPPRSSSVYSDNPDINARSSPANNDCNVNPDVDTHQSSSVVYSDFAHTDGRHRFGAAFAQVTSGTWNMFFKMSSFICP